MITLKPTVQFDGPYRRRLNWLEIALSALGHVAIALILAYAVLGMAGAWDKAEACVSCQERMSK